jgi:hypothetical protein
MPQYKSGYVAYAVNMYKLTAYRLFHFEDYCSLGRDGVKSEGCVQALQSNLLTPYTLVTDPTFALAAAKTQNVPFLLYVKQH